MMTVERDPGFVAPTIGIDAIADRRGDSRRAWSRPTSDGRVDLAGRPCSLRSVDPLMPVYGNIARPSSRSRRIAAIISLLRFHRERSWACGLQPGAASSHRSRTACSCSAMTPRFALCAFGLKEASRRGECVADNCEADRSARARVARRLVQQGHGAAALRWCTPISCSSARARPARS